MKYLLFLIAGLFYLQPAFACKCLPQPPLKDLSQLKGYSFIARVRIMDDGDAKKPNGMETGVLRIQVVQLFKGSKRTQLYEMAKGSSCDMYIAKGQEWLVFGKMEQGKLSIGPCDRNVLYSLKENGQTVITPDAGTLLKQLQQLYRKKKTA